MIKPIAKSQVTQEVGERLKNLIVSGAYKPGDRLPPIKELAASLQVGQTTVREGLRQLESLGLIRLQHGSGVYVSESFQFPLLVRPITSPVPLDEKVFDDLISMRQILETGAAWLAATHASDEHIERLGRLLDDMEETLDDPEAFSRNNAEFHMCVAESTGNQFIPMILKAVRDLIVTHQERLNASEEVRRRSMRFHRFIYEAIAAHNANLARQAMEEHLSDIGSEVMKASRS